MHRAHAWCAGIPSKTTFFAFGPKNVHVFCSCESPCKNFPVFTLESDRPCLNWQLIWFLTSWPIYNPFKLQPKWIQKSKIWLWHQFYYRAINCRKICNVPLALDALMCPLRFINWHWTYIIDPSWCKCKGVTPVLFPQKTNGLFHLTVDLINLIEVQLTVIQFKFCTQRNNIMSWK